MQLLTKDILRGLAGRTGLSLSVYMPARPTGADARQDEVRLKNLLSMAEKELCETHGLTKNDADTLLGPVHRMLGNGFFLQNRIDGLALFIQEGLVMPLRLPIDVPERVYVSTSFLLTPLIPLLQSHQDFLILALSQEYVRLLHASQSHVHAVTLSDTPGGIRQALGEEKQEAATQVHGPANGAIVHGHGALHDHKKRDLRDYLHQVHSVVKPLLQPYDAPLILASTAAIIGLYREMNDYSHLLEETIHGNVDEISDIELRDRGWEIVKPVLEEKMQKQLDRFGEAKGRNLVATEIDNIIPAAAEGRVALLLVQRGATMPGTYDSTDRTITKNNESSDDLLNIAALQTLLTDGEMVMIDKEKMPDGAMIAAAYRY